jgi:hypothetical protein
MSGNPYAGFMSEIKRRVGNYPLNRLQWVELRKLAIDFFERGRRHEAARRPKAKPVLGSYGRQAWGYRLTPKALKALQ